MTDIADIEPPSQNEQVRDSFKQIIGGLTTEVITEFNNLRKRIDALENVLLIKSSRIESELTEYAALRGEVQQEIARLNGIVDAKANQVNGHGNSN